MFEHGDIDRAVPLGHADAFAEIPNRFRRITAAPKAGQRRHSRIVPAADMILLHQLQKLAFAQRRIGEIEPGKLDLLRMMDSQLFEKPIVQRPVIFEF